MLENKMKDLFKPFVLSARHFFQEMTGVSKHEHRHPSIQIAHRIRNLLRTSGVKMIVFCQFKKKSIVICLCACVVMSCAKKIENKNERNKTMTCLSNQKNGAFLAQDQLGNSVILQWEEITGKTEKLSEKIRSLAEILVPSYTKSEVEFARKKPEDVPQDFMLKSLAPLLEQGVDNVDWNLFEEKTKNILEQFFMTLDWAQYAGDNDVTIFVLALDQKTNKKLGVIQFLITPEFAKNNVKAALSGVLPSAHDRGLEQLLMSSIFKLRSGIERVFTDTRATNEQFIHMHEKWGFSHFKGEIPNFTDLEYFVEKSDTLQKVSDAIVFKN